jgi:hypothetical protein
MSVPQQPFTDNGLGQALQNVIDGNETVLVGATLSSGFMALLAFGIHKGWITEIDAQYILGIATPLVIVLGVVIRQKVYSKGTAAELLETDPNGPLSQGEVKLLAAAK